MSAATGGGGTIAGDELGAFLLFHGKGRIWLEAAATAGFIRAHGTDDDEFFALHKALRVHGGIAAADADGEQLSDFFGDGQQTRHGLEGTAAIIGVETSDDDALPEIGELSANVNDCIAKELRFVDTHDLGASGESTLHSCRKTSGRR